MTDLARVNGIKTDIPRTYSEISLFSLFYHWFWFLIGYLFYYKRQLLEHKFSYKVYIPIIRLGNFSHLLHLFLVDEQNFKNYSVNFIRSSTTLIWIILLLSISNQYLNKNKKILTLIIELSYPIYLIHIIPAIGVGVKLFEMNYNSTEIMLPNILLSGIISVLSYYIFIKYTPLNWCINGYKKSWFQPF